MEKKRGKNKKQQKINRQKEYVHDKYAWMQTKSGSYVPLPNARYSPYKALMYEEWWGQRWMPQP